MYDSHFIVKPTVEVVLTFLWNGASKQLTVPKLLWGFLLRTSGGGCRQFRPAPGMDWGLMAERSPGADMLRSALPV